MSKKILVCDDDQSILEVIRIILEEKGYEVIVFDNCDNIYKRIARLKPDLIFLDLWMPGISGEEVAVNLKKDPKTKKIPIVILSANNETKNIAKKIKADEYLCKPFNIDDLEKTIKRFI